LPPLAGIHGPISLTGVEEGETVKMTLKQIYKHLYFNNTIYTYLLGDVRYLTGMVLQCEMLVSYSADKCSSVLGSNSSVQGVLEWFSHMSVMLVVIFDKLFLSVAQSDSS
jgi:hypothetical protein